MKKERVACLAVNVVLACEESEAFSVKEHIADAVADAMRKALHGIPAVTHVYSVQASGADLTETVDFIIQTGR